MASVNNQLSESKVLEQQLKHLNQELNYRLSGERDVNQMYVWLSVNNTNEIDAVAESAHAAQDIQGGNAANLKLMKGDAVFLKHYFHGTHIEGSDSTRISSFSGFLLYPTESVAIIGK